MPVHGRHQTAGEQDEYDGEPDQVVEGGQAELRCDPGGACLKHGCQWTLPGTSSPNFKPNLSLSILAAPDAQEVM